VFGVGAAALAAAALPAARKLAARHLVSRDTTGLDAGEVGAAAALESLAENLSDGVVAPWFWYAIGAAPAAWAYRALNTLDRMWGYRTPEYIDFGSAAARIDDAANLAPARLTALAIIASAAPEGSGASALATWWRDRAGTPSPNAGQPMAAMAGATGTALTERGLYNLGAGFPPPTPADLRRGIRVARRVAWTTAGFALAGTIRWRN
jgi:adenosylcobinamide-phosphate synthase